MKKAKVFLVLGIVFAVVGIFGCSTALLNLVNIYVLIGLVGIVLSLVFFLVAFASLLKEDDKFNIPEKNGPKAY
jgi:hypothetical protein